MSFSALANAKRSCGYVFKIFDVDDSESLDREELGDLMWCVYSAFLDSSSVDERTQEVNSFVHIAFSRGGTRSESLTFAGFKEISVIQPLIFRYLSNRGSVKVNRANVEDAHFGIHDLLQAHEFVRIFLSNQAILSDSHRALALQHLQESSSLIRKLEENVEALSKQLKLEQQNALANRAMLDELLRSK